MTVTVTVNGEVAGACGVYSHAERTRKERSISKEASRSSEWRGGGKQKQGGPCLLGQTLSQASSCCELMLPARRGYLENQIAFGVSLLFARLIRAETPPPFCALFLEILQDLENKRETQDSRKEQSMV